MATQSLTHGAMEHPAPWTCKVPSPTIPILRDNHGTPTRESTSSPPQKRALNHTRRPLPTRMTVRLPQRSTFSGKKDQSFEDKHTQEANTELSSGTAEMNSGGIITENPRSLPEEDTSGEKKDDQACADHIAPVVIDTRERHDHPQTPNSVSEEHHECISEDGTDLQPNEADHTHSSSPSIQNIPHHLIQQLIHDELASFREQGGAGSLSSVDSYCRQVVQNQAVAFEARLARIEQQLEAAHLPSPAGTPISNISDQEHRSMDYPSPSSLPSDGRKASTPEPISLSREMPRYHTGKAGLAQTKHSLDDRKSYSSHPMYGDSVPPFYTPASSPDPVDEVVKSMIFQLQNQLKDSQDECARLRAALEQRTHQKTKPYRQSAAGIPHQHHHYQHQPASRPQGQPQRHVRERTSSGDRHQPEWHSRCNTPFKQVRTYSPPRQPPVKAHEDSIKVENGYIEFRSVVDNQVVLCRVKAPSSSATSRSSGHASRSITPPMIHHSQHDLKKPGLNPYAREWVGSLQKH